MNLAWVSRLRTDTVELTPDTAILQLRACAAAPIHVRVNDHAATLHAGQTYRFDLTDAEAHRRAGTAAAGARRPGADRPAPGTQR